MDTTHKEMQSFSARLRTFETAQPIRKRQATGLSKKKTPSAAEWPLKKPDPVLLARAGFFYRPDQDSFDNVTCFLCNVRLDGWEETDVPIQEHLAHTRGCPWATAVSVFRGDEDTEPESRDPLSEDMLDARKATFTIGEGWPHEDKKGWKCKIAKMVQSGWCWDPSAEEGDGVDGVTCFYCGLSLDGWEPNDDPFTEHKRREPACRYFELLEHFHGVDAANGKIKKSKGASKGARASNASKASRMSRMSRTSAMSAITATSDVPSMPGSYIDPLEDVDDSNVTTATNASQATATGTTKSKKKGGRTKAPAKGTKARKKATEEPKEDVQYPVLEAAPIDQQLDEAVPSKTSKRGTRASKQIDSSVFEISQSEMIAPKKSTKTKKAQREPTPEAEQIQRHASTAAAWVEMQNDFQADNFEPGDQSTPAAEPKKPKRGVKRSSDGSRKHEALDSSVNIAHADAETDPEPAAKRKRGRPKKTSASSVNVKAGMDVSEDVSTAQHNSAEMDTTEEPAKKGKVKAKGKKVSSTRSSRSSKAKPDPVDMEDGPEDLARDEMEIEQELARIAAEQTSQQAVQEEQDQKNEFEPSPSSGRISKDSAELQKLQDEVDADGENARQQDQSTPRRSYAPADMTPSPNGSDKENRDSSLVEPSAKQAQPAVVLSPTKTVKIPLAASTPNRSPRKAMLSPSKQISHLASTKPWTAIDPDVALIPTHLSENAENVEPGQLSELLLDAAGDLASPEKKMTVEEWIRYRAEKSEQDLRRRCELMVSAFEKEGMRALESVHGIHTVG